MCFSVIVHSGFAIILIFIIINFNFIVAFHTKLQDYESEIAYNFSAALAQIVELYFVEAKFRTGYNFQIKTKYKKNEQFFEEIVETTMKLLGENIGVTVSNDADIAENDEMHYSILLVDSLESLKFLYKNIIEYDLYIYGSFFIVLHSLCCTSRYYDELAEIFEVSWSAGISHSSVLVYAVRNVIVLFHGMPFTAFECSANAPEINNKFIDGQWQHRNFYVSKATNIYGCPLVCATWEDMPYFKVDPLSTREKPKFMGIEGKLLEYLAERMNFTLEMRWLTDEEINQTIYDQRNLFKTLFHEGTDFSLGAFHYKYTSREDPYTPTMAYYPSTYYFVLSSRTDPYEPFEKLLLPFGMDIWAVLILFKLIGNAIIYFANRMDDKWKSLVLGRRNDNPHYNMIVTLFGGQAAHDPKVPFSRFLLMMWTLATSVLRTIYQGLMFHFIKHDIHKRPPKILADLRTSNYTVYLTDVVFSYVQHFLWLRDNANILNGTEVESFELLTDPAIYKTQKIAILSSYEYFGYFKQFHYGSKVFHLIPEILFTQQLSIYMKKNSVFLNRFNLYIDNYVNEGLMNRLERILIFGDRSYRRFAEEEARPMKLRQLYGALNLLYIGFALSFCVFVAELGIVGLKSYITSANKVWLNMTKKRRPQSRRFEFLE